MERTKKDEKPIWKCLHHRSFYVATRPHQRVKPNEKIQVEVEALGRHRDKFELIQDGTGIYAVEEAAQVEEPSTTVAKETVKKQLEDEVYQLKHAGGGKYNVISPVGVVVNDNLLTRAEAEALVESLNEETPQDNE